MPEAKFRLHATKVDRIAVVDRPAVPDAQIVLFKRRDGKQDDVLLKNTEFGDNLLSHVTDGAINALEQSFWGLMFNSEMSSQAKKSGITKLFKNFKQSVFQLMDIPEVTKTKAQEEPTPSEIASSFKRGLASTAIQEAFVLFKSHLSWFVMNGKQFAESTDIIDKLIDTFRDYVSATSQDIISKKLTVDKAEVLEKEGRKISTRRLAKLREALAVLANIIEDAENRANEKQQEEPMETKDKNKDAVLSFEKYETMSPEDKYSLLSIVLLINSSFRDA